MLSLAPLPLAAQTYSTSGTVFSGYSAPGYVIDSDRTIDVFEDGEPFTSSDYDRWYLPVEATGTVSDDPDGPEREFRMAFSLIDSMTGDPVDLQDVETSDTTTVAYSEIRTITGNGSETFPANLVVHPDLRLDPNRSYLVRAQLQEWRLTFVDGSFQFVWTDVGDSDESANRRFVHFKGPWGTDSAYNVVARGDAHFFSRRYALRNVPEQAEFATTVFYSLYRYDEPHTFSSDTDTITVRLTAELFDAADPETPIALTRSLYTEDVAVERTLTSGGAPVPMNVIRNVAIEFEPTVQLDPVDTTYFVRVSVAHVEDPTMDPPAVVDSNSLDTSASRLLHLNGDLNFGAIATTLDGVSSVDAPGAISGGFNLTTIAGAEGTLNGAAHTYGPGDLDVSVDPSGTAYTRAPSTIALDPPGTPDRGSAAGIRFDRGGIMLASTGASAGSLSVILPAGFGIGESRDSKRLDGRLDVSGPVPIGQELTPLEDPSVSFSPNRYAVEETKPVAMEIVGIDWEVGAGVLTALPASGGPARYVRAAEMDALDAVPLPDEEKIKRSNELYYRATARVESDIRIRAGFNNGAEMSAVFALESGSGLLVRSHFPWDATYEVAGGGVVVRDDRVDPEESRLDLADPLVKVPWTGGCSLPACEDLAGNFSYVAFEVRPDDSGNARLGISGDGGLFAAGSLPDPLELKWGHIPARADHAHRVNTPFEEARFAIAGHFVHGEESLGTGLGQFFGPGTILLSGVDEAGNLTERPLLDFDGTTPYQAGLADYPGLNFRLGPPDGESSGIDGRSLLGGEEYGPYPLKNRSKYYIRASGVSGIHDEVFGSPVPVPIYGYDMTLETFGLAFLGNTNVDSRTSGEVFLPYPSDIDIAFERLMFHCNGGLDEAQIGEDSTQPTLAYWSAPLDLHTMQFATGDACDVGQAFLTLGVTGYSSHIEQPLHGTLGVFNHGNLIPKEFSDTIGGGLAGVDSRLRMPPNAGIRGPKRRTTEGGHEEYVLTPVVDAYLNNPGLPGDGWDIGEDREAHPPGEGFINFAGRLKVSFFEAMEAHLQTSPNRPPEGGDPPGSWGTAVLHVANGAWETGGAEASYFAGDYHDSWNRGFPYPSGGGGTGESVETYRTSPEFFPFVRQEWLGGAITLKYKVQWNSTTRSFRSLDAADSVDADDGYSPADTRKFVIVSVDHRLTYLSAERAELTFGAEYDGMPSINLSNFVVNQVDDVTGVFQAATEAGLDAVFDELDGAVNDLARALNDNQRAFYERILDEPVDGFVDKVYGYLEAEWNRSGSDWRQDGTVPGLDPVFADFRGDVIDDLDPALGAALGQVAELLRILQEVEDALVTVRDDFLATDPTTEELQAIKTLTRELIKMLSDEVGGNLGSALGAAGVDETLSELLDPLLEDVKPTVAEVHDVVSELADAVAEINDALGGGEDFREHLETIYADANAEFTSVRSEVQGFVQTRLDEFGPRTNFLARDPDEVRVLIRNAIYDNLLDTGYVEEAQVAVKQRLYDVEHAIRQALDSAFAQVNSLVKDALSDFLAEVDEEINGVIGEDMSDRMGSGSLQGYAVFNGDALRKVRIDGVFELKIPDETKIEAFLEINQYTSADQPPGCIELEPGEAFTEVEIGALDVGCNFIADDLRVNITAKFTMKSTGGAWSLRPNGMGGSFEMTSGEISFEAFKITDLKCGVMFGATENYVTAALALEFGSWGAKGGVFFGQTCTLDPIRLWDPLVADTLGEASPTSTFTGMYVYGEAHIPVSEAILGIPASCVFKITADAGAGFFVFAEGPTYGARMALGVGGEILCLVSIKGRIDMVGARVGSVTRMTGKGTVRGEIGACPFCIKIKKSATMETEIGSDGEMAGKGGAN